MVAVAQLAKDYGLEFVYYSPSLSPHLKRTPVGNFQAAMDMGMKFIEDNRTPEDM